MTFTHHAFSAHSLAFKLQHALSFLLNLLPFTISASELKRRV